MDKQKQIEEMEKDIAVRMAMAKGIAGSMNNGVEGWLSEYLYNAGYRKIPEGAVVLTREEYGLLVTRPNLHIATDVYITRKETAEKFARLVEFHSVSTRDNDGREIFTISALSLKEILHEEFGIPYDEICKEFTEGRDEKG